MRDRSFWYVSLGHGIAVISVFAVLVHLVPHLKEGYGWSEISAQAVLTLVTMTSIIGQVGGGFVGDRYNKARMAGIFTLGHALAMVLLALAPNGSVVVLAAMLHGLSWGARGPLMMSLRADYYGRRHFGQIAGYSNVIVMFGPLIRPTVCLSDAGRLWQLPGSVPPDWRRRGHRLGSSSLPRVSLPYPSGCAPALPLKSDLNYERRALSALAVRYPDSGRRPSGLVNSAPTQPPTTLFSHLSGTSATMVLTSSATVIINRRLCIG